MKKLVLIFVMIFSLGTMAQENQRTENWFDFPDKHTLDSPRLIKVQHNLFIDPFGKAPDGSGGRQFGYKFTAIMGWGYLEPSVSAFPQLKDGYIDFANTFGINWHMFRTTAIRYYAGYRLGLEWRPKRGGTPFPFMGMTLGADLTVITFKSGTSIYIGGEIWVDHRSSQHDDFYGDSTGYDGGTIFTNSQAKENGRINLGFRF